MRGWPNVYAGCASLLKLVVIYLNSNGVGGMKIINYFYYHGVMSHVDVLGRQARD